MTTPTNKQTNTIGCLVLKQKDRHSIKLDIVDNKKKTKRENSPNTCLASAALSPLYKASIPCVLTTLTAIAVKRLSTTCCVCKCTWNKIIINNMEVKDTKRALAKGFVLLVGPEDECRLRHRQKQVHPNTISVSWCSCSLTFSELNYGRG